MSDIPKPPNGHDSWLEYAIFILHTQCGKDWGKIEGESEFAAAELDALRAERDRYRKALEDIVDHLKLGNYPSLAGPRETSMLPAVTEIARKALEARDGQ